MKGPQSILLFAATLMMTCMAHATVLFLEPFGLALGGSTESDVRGYLGTPDRRTVLPQDRLQLHFRAHDLSVSEVEAQLWPDADGTPRLESVLITYRTPHTAGDLRSQYGLGMPQWEELDTFNNRDCRVEYYSSGRLSHYQSASLGLVLCSEQPSGEKASLVTMLRYLSPRAFGELGQRQASRWGYIDKSGKFVLPRSYDDAGAFEAGAASVRVAEKRKHIDHQGRLVRDVRTGEPFYLEVPLQPKEVAGKWGFIDKSGRLSIPASFDAAEPFQEKFAAVKVGERWGFIDERGEWIAPPQFLDVRNFFEDLAAVNRNGLWGYIDRRGQFVIPPRFAGAGDFGEGLAPVK